MVMVYFDKEVMLVSCVRSLTNLITLVLIMIIYISDLITMHFLLSAHQAIIWFWLHQFTEDRGYVNSSKSIVCLKYFEIWWGTRQAYKNASGTQKYNSHVCADIMFMWWWWVVCKPILVFTLNLSQAEQFIVVRKVEYHHIGFIFI